MSRLLLHIGAPKTGTTAIQSFLERNRPLLETSFDISVPRLLSYKRAAAMRAYAMQRVSQRRIEKLGVESLSQFNSDYEEQIGALAKSLVTTTAICSNELLFSLDRPAVKRLKNAFSPLFSSFRVVLYLRRQDLLETAAYLQAYKGGYEELHAFGTVLKRRRPGYLLVLKTWTEIFGSENVAAFLYDDVMREEADVVAHFMRVVGIEDLSGFREATKGNTSWGFHQAWAARVIRKHYRNATLEDIRSVVEAMEPGPRYPVSRSEAVAFYRSFARENEMIRRQRFPHKATLFEEEFGMYPQTFDIEAEKNNCRESEVLERYNAVSRGAHISARRDLDRVASGNLRIRARQFIRSVRSWF